MAGRILIDDGNRLLDSNGDPISGGKLKAFTAGTSTPAALYTTSALSVEHANPVVANSAGFLAQMWADEDVILDVKTYAADDTSYTTPLREFLNVRAISSTAARTVVATRTALKALPTSVVTVAYLNEDGRQGTFAWDSSDLSTEVATDTEEGIYVAPTDGTTGAWVRQEIYEIRCEWFGADPSLADNATAIQAAIDYAMVADRNEVTLGFGAFEFSTQITLATVGSETHGFVLAGRDSNQQSGSNDEKSTRLHWTGGAEAMVACSVSYPVFRRLGIENRGTATDFLECNSGTIGPIIEDCAFNVPSGATAFSRSIIRSNGNRLGYTEIRRNIIKSCAPVFMSIDGQGTGNNNTSVLFELNRCDTAALAMTIVDLRDEGIERLTFRHNTFNINAPGNPCTIVDTTQDTPEADPPLDPTIMVLDFSNNEIDVGPVISPTSARHFKLENVRNIRFDNNHIDSDGAQTALAELTNSHVTSCEGNYVTSLAGPLFDLLDTVSTVVCGKNEMDTSSSQGVFNDATGGVHPLTYGATVNVGLSRGNAQTQIFSVTVTDANNLTMTLRNQSGYSRPAPGAVFIYDIRNESGGAMGTVSFNANHTLRNGAFTSPADGTGRWISFYWDGTKAIELARGAADATNS